MIGKFAIEFNVSGNRHTAIIENYLLPGQVRVKKITPDIPDFPSEIIFQKDHVAKTLVYHKELDQEIQAQIIEAVHHKATMEGRPLYMDGVK